MDVFITNETAPDFWRLYRRSGENHTYTPSRRKPPCQSPDSYVLRHGQAWGLSLPLDIMVSAQSAGRSSKAIRSHVCSKALPGGAFVNVSNFKLNFNMLGKLTLDVLIQNPRPRHCEPLV